MSEDSQEQGHRHFGGRRALVKGGGKLGECRVSRTEKSVWRACRPAGLRGDRKEVSEINLIEKDVLHIHKIGTSIEFLA